jgi:hypothetical protein
VSQNDPVHAISLVIHRESNLFEFREVILTGLFAGTLKDVDEIPTTAQELLTYGVASRRV